ncbi:MAG: Fe-S cluster assembly protein SufD, partial [Alphaproteobacteria bacterium]|nr:Fe-S cluster assembly protein SufD [Alphaproteobacteria bacterium]
ERDGLPGRRVEAFRYTDLRSRLGVLPPPAPARIAVEGPLGAVRIRSLAEDLAAGEAGALTLSGPAPHPVEAVVAALAEDGLTLTVPKGVRLEAPLVLRHLAEGAGPSSRALRILIRLEEGAEAVLHEEIGQSAGAGVAFVHLGVELAASSRLAHLRIQTAEESLAHIALLRGRVGRAASYTHGFLTLGGGLSRHEIDLDLTGEGAEATIHGGYHVGGERLTDTTSYMRHAVPRCRSAQTVKGVAGDEAHGVFQGRISVERNAQGTDGAMLTKALLLDRRAEVDLKPELVIHADDVKCSHGATIGELDADQLFYLMARGLPEPEARGLLVRAFLGEVSEAVGGTFGTAACERFEALAGAALERLQGREDPA